MKDLVGVQEVLEVFVYKMVEMVVPMEELNDPMGIRFMFRTTNISDIVLYVKSELVSPPVGWTGIPEEHGAIGVGVGDYFLNDNYTRTKPSTDTEESVTLRITYYSDAGYSNEVSHEDVDYIITYVDFNDGSYNIVDDDGFEVDLEGWTRVNEAGTSELKRDTSQSHSGVASMRHANFQVNSVAYASKSFTISNVTRAYIRVWFWFVYIETTEGIFELITDAGGVSQKRVLPLAMDGTPKGGTEIVQQWICVGLKLPVNGTFEVRLRWIPEYYAAAHGVAYDDIRVVES